MAHYVVGVDSAASGIKVAVLDASLRGVELKRAETFEWKVTELAEVPPPPTEAPTEPPSAPYEDKASEGNALAEQIAEVCAQLQVGSADFFLGWDGNRAATRIVSFPIGDLRKIDGMLAFELEDQLARGLDDMIYAHQAVSVTREKTDILVATAERAAVKNFIDQGAALGYAPRSLFLESFSLFALAGEVQNGLIIDIGHTKTQILVMAGGKPVYSRTLREGGRRVDQALAKAMQTDERSARIEKERIGEITDVIAAGLKPLILGVKQTFLSHKPLLGMAPTIHLTGGMAYLPGIDSFFMRELGTETRLLRLPKALAGLPDGHRYSLAYALAMTGASSARQPRLDFRTGELSFRGDLSGLRNQGTRWAMGAAIILALAFTSGLARFLVLRSDEAKLDEALVQVTKAMMGREMSDFKQAINAIRQSVNPEKSVLPRFSALDYYGIVSSRIAAEADVKLTEIELRQDKILMKGDGASFEMVDKAVEGLKGHECFKAVVPGKTRKSLDGQRVEFSVQIDLSCGNT